MHNEQRASNNIGRPRRKANFCVTFSSINYAFAVVQKYLAGTVFVCYYHPVARNHSVDQSTDSVCSSNLPGPFQESQYLNGVVLWDEYGSIRLSLGHAHFWQWKHNPCRTFADWTDQPPALEMRHITKWLKQTKSRTVKLQQVGGDKNNSPSSNPDNNCYKIWWLFILKQFKTEAIDVVQIPTTLSSLWGSWPFLEQET